MVADSALRHARGLDGIAAATPLLQRVRGVALLGLGRRAEAEAALRESLTAARGRKASHDICFALEALLAAGPEVGGSERRAWGAGLERLRRQLGIVT